jgi:hypothetical protein
VTTFLYNPDRGLFVPTAADPGVALAQASGYMHAAIGWKELYPDDEPTTLSALTRLAAQLSAEGILYLVSILQLVMRRRYGGDRAAYLRDQLDVAKELSPRTSLSAFGSKLRPPARTPSFTRPNSSSRHCWPSTSASPGTALTRIRL